MELRSEEYKSRIAVFPWFGVLTFKKDKFAPNSVYIRKDTIISPEVPIGEFPYHTIPDLKKESFLPPSEKEAVRKAHEAYKPTPKDLTVDQRLINRFARAYMSIQKVPHVAAAFYGGSLHIATNTDQHPLSSTLDLSADPSSELKGTRLEQYMKMYRKLRMLGGAYQARHPALSRALSDAVGQAVSGTAPPTVIAPKEKGKLHGEMLLLDNIAEKPVQSGRLQRLFIGGSLLDCIFCHWAFAIFNETVGVERNIQIISSGTHGHVPPYWDIPEWMLGSEKAIELFCNKLVGLLGKYLIKGADSQAADNAASMLSAIKSGRICIFKQDGKNLGSMSGTIIEASDSEPDS